MSGLEKSRKGRVLEREPIYKSCKRSLFAHTQALTEDCSLLLEQIINLYKIAAYQQHANKLNRNVALHIKIKINTIQYALYQKR